MPDYIEPLEALVEQFRRFEGIGRKTAVRLAFGVLDFSEEDAREFAEAILDAKSKIKFCRVCQNITDQDECSICTSSVRDRSVICVVEDIRSLMSIERIKEYRGLYHVLHGALSPIKGIGPDKLKIKELLYRLQDDTVKELILATNLTVEGEATAMYISKLVKPLGVRVSRIANGVPVGGDLEYTDEMTIYRALEGRRDI